MFSLQPRPSACRYLAGSCTKFRKFLCLSSREALHWNRPAAIWKRDGRLQFSLKDKSVPWKEGSSHRAAARHGWHSAPAFRWFRWGYSCAAIGARTSARVLLAVYNPRRAGIFADPMPSRSDSHTYFKGNVEDRDHVHHISETIMERIRRLALESERRIHSKNPFPAQI